MSKRDRDLDKMKQDALSKIREAEKATYAWACECEVGPERIRAFEIYDNVRTATRVG